MGLEDSPYLRKLEEVAAAPRFNLFEIWARKYIKLDGTETKPLHHLSQYWAKKYVEKLAEHHEVVNTSSQTDIYFIAAQQLKESLRSVSVKAWERTESLLAAEIKRHQIDPLLINPWEISKDVHQIYEKTLSAYAERVTPQEFSVLLSMELGNIRKKYTAVDPRVIGFVSMQFHYSGQLLLTQSPELHQSKLGEYFKVIDDHLYMPLRRAYDAAASHDYDSPQLRTVQRLLPASSDIARTIVDRVIVLYPNYYCHTGLLSEPIVRISSIRDVEMFQVYLWVCVLEGSINAVQQELFPLCAMLYPTLKVSWELVRQMLYQLRVRIRSHLSPEDMTHYEPYAQAIWMMFSPEIFPN